MRSAVAMTVTAQATAGVLQVTVDLRQRRRRPSCAHRPSRPGTCCSPSPASDALSQPLGYLGHEVLPAWGGAQAGQPGKIYAKVLQDVATGETPGGQLLEADAHRER